MKVRAIGIYREAQFSPGKVDADAAILDAVLNSQVTELKPLRWTRSGLPPVPRPTRK